MGIEWLPISDLPDAFKDGRQVLIWDDGSAVVCFWRHGGSPSVTGWDTGYASEMYGDPIMAESVTHFAEITPPS